MLHAANLADLSGIGHGFYNRFDSKDVPNPLLMTQVHSADVRVISAPDLSQPSVDAWVSKTAGLCLTVKTADCAPVLLADPIAKVIGAVHAGWKGAFQGVIENTILEMMKQGADLKHIRAAVGPCLHRESFEVDSGFKALFPVTENHFFTARGDKFLFDFAAYVRYRIQRAGVQNIEVVDVDTYTDTNYLSYRRDPVDPARQFSCIWIQD